MSVSLSEAKLHLNITGTDDDAQITRLLSASQAHVETQLGFALQSRFNNAVPADIDQCVLMIVAHWYENREASLTQLQAMPLPLGVDDIIRNHRDWAF